MTRRTKEGAGAVNRRWGCTRRCPAAARSEAHGERGCLVEIKTQPLPEYCLKRARKKFHFSSLLLTTASCWPKLSVTKLVRSLGSEVYRKQLPVKQHRAEEDRNGSGAKRSRGWQGRPLWVWTEGRTLQMG